MTTALLAIIIIFVGILTPYVQQHGWRGDNQDWDKEGK